MAKERNATKAGAFILLCGAMAFGIIVAIQGLGLEPVQLRVVTFKLTDDISGLRVGDEVRIGGFNVGEVRTIELAGVLRAAAQPTTGPAVLDSIRVVISLPARYVLREGAVIGIQKEVTGKSCLNFSSLGRGAALKDEQALAGRPSPFSALFEVATKLREETLPEINGTIAELRTGVVPRIEGILDDVRGKSIPEINRTVASYRGAAEAAVVVLKALREHLDPIVARYNRVAESAAGALGELQDIFGGGKGDIRGTLKNLNTATGTVKDRLPGVFDGADRVLKHVDEAVVSTKKSLEDVQATTENARHLTAAARSVLVGNKSRLDGMIASMKATADNLKGASAEIRRSPWRLLYQPKANEVSNLNIYDSARLFADGAGGLSDAAHALRDAVKDPQSDAEQIRKLLNRLDEAFKNFNSVEQKLWEAVKE